MRPHPAIRIAAVLLFTSGVASAAFPVSPFGFAEESCASSWQVVDRPASYGLRSVAWGNGTYVAVSWHSVIVTSPDGTTWTRRVASADDYFQSVVFGGGQFVVVGMGGAILTSPDGTTWTARESGFQPYAYDSVTWGAGRFVAVGLEGFGSTRWSVATSVDGVKWQHVSGGGGVLKGVAWGNGQFVAVGRADGDAILTSVDGKTWVKRSTPPIEYLQDVAYGSGLFVVLSLFGPALTSPDGVSWSVLPPSSWNFYGIAYCGGQFLALGSAPILTSPDGVNWTSRSWGGNGMPRDAAYGDGQFIVVTDGGATLSSPDAVFWWNRAWGMAALNAATFGAGQFATVGADGTILTSPDGTAWTQRFSGTHRALAAVVYGGGQFVAAGAAGTILTSPDGVDWTPRSSATTPDFTGVAWGDGRYVAVGRSSAALTSSDGVTWTSEAGGAVANAIVRGRDRFVSVGPYGSIRTSPSGRDWMDQSSGTGSHLYAAAYGGGQYMAVGASGIILTSPDGSVWTARSSGTGVDLKAVGFAGGRFVATGVGALLTSTDGIVWTDPRETPVNLPGEGIAWGAGRFVLVGGGLATSACAATFSSLTVGRTGAGTGRVTSRPEGIDCGSNCVASFETGTEVVLSAAPDTGSFLAGWEGDCSGSAACRVVVSRSLSVTARFEAGSSYSVTRFVPIVLDVTGLAHYTSELQLTNLGASAATVKLTYTSSMGSGSGDVTETVPAGQQVVFPDAISYFRSSGVSIPTSGSQGGTLLLSSSSPGLHATVRTSAETVRPQPFGRAGLAYSDTDPTASSSAAKVFVYGLRTNAADRSNLAVYNMGPDPVSLKVSVVSGDDASLFDVTEGVPLSLPAYGWYQYSGVLNSAGFSSGYAIVERVEGSGPFGAYGVVNDQVTNDGSFVPALPGTESGSRFTIPVLVETSAFESELILANRGGAAATFTLSYVESLSPGKGPGGTATIALAAGRQRIIPKAIDFLRSNGVRAGPRGEASYAGSLQVRVSGVGLESVFAGVRTSSLSPAGGQFGLFYPAIGSGEEAWDTAFILGLKADVNNRSNVAVLHTGDAASGPITLELQVLDGSEGGRAVGPPLAVTLTPGQWAQPPGFFAGGGVPNGYVRIQRTAGTAPWYAYGVVNDGASPGDRTGDGAYVPMVK